MKRKHLLIALAAAIVLYIAFESFSQAGIKDLKGDFKELAFYRTEQNTGPVLRIYAVSLSDTLWKEMEDYGNYMPHTKYGITRVYYFLNRKPSPSSLSAEDGSFDYQYKENCIGKYEKGAMSQTVLIKYPFREKSH
jgi:hypothetical protein